MIVYGLYLAGLPASGTSSRSSWRTACAGPDSALSSSDSPGKGLLTPDAWMRGAVDEPIATRALLAAASEALAQ